MPTFEVNFACDEVLVVRATVQDDFTKRQTVDKAIKCTSRRRGHVHYYSPCTVGCTVNINVNMVRCDRKTRNSIIEHWQIHDRM